MRTKLVVLNGDGQVLGEIDTPRRSRFEQINGIPILLINAPGLDQEGNAYVADTAFGRRSVRSAAADFEPPAAGEAITRCGAAAE